MKILVQISILLLMIIHFSTVYAQNFSKFCIHMYIRTYIGISKYVKHYYTASLKLLYCVT